MYEIIYDIDEFSNCVEKFEGSWNELQEYIHQMKTLGCYNITANEMYSERED